MIQEKNGFRIVEEEGVGRLEVWDLDASQEALQRLLADLFENHWRKITFGPLIQGAAWEIRAESAPRSITMLDGYLTVDFGNWHFHLCIGQHKGSRQHPVDPRLARHRRTSRAELYRQINCDGAPNYWALRLFNGADEQQITVILPSPFLSDEMRYLKTPDFSRLELWDYLRSEYLGLGPDPRDRSGKRMIHG